MNLENQAPEQLKKLEAELSAAYAALQEENLNLDITRGKPSTDQVTLSDSLDGILEGNYITDSGIDTRNYGHLRGIPETLELGGNLLGVPSENIITGGNSSLTLMYFIALFQHSFNTNEQAWKTLDKPTFICPVPGYDRHFSICDSLDINMVTVPLTETGPDMDAVEHLINTNDQIVGMWCVPHYSNPTGTTYSDETVARIAQLGTIAQPHFRVFWDNAYAVHTLEDQPQKLANIWEACKKHGTESSVWQFASTSKISFAGSGVSWVASSASNLEAFEKLLGVTTIGSDKVNQLRHHRLFPSIDALKAHMRKHANSLKAKFDTVLTTLHEELEEYGNWTEAKGGYFVSFDSQPGLASNIVQLAADAGLKLTPAGATYPYGNDPTDSNIRIAPSFPPLDELEQAMKVFTVCVKLATVQKMLET